MKKILSGVISCCLAAALLAGCSTYAGSASSSASAASAADTATADTVNVLGGVAVTMNQFKSQSSNDGDIFYLTMTPLLRYYDNQIEMDGAESYDVSTDGLTYTFHLRKDLCYSDGTAITSADYEYAFKKIMGPDSGTSTTEGYFGVVGAEDYNSGTGSWENVGFKCTDQYTIVITLDAADGSFADQMALYPFSPATEQFPEKWGDSLGSSPESVQCSGPYVLTQWTVDKSMALTKNDKWWNTQNEFPTQNISINSISSGNTKVSMFKNGEADIINSIEPTYAQLLGSSAKQYESATEMFLWVKQQGTSDEATACLKNDNFRKALLYSLDRTSISAAVNPGFIGTNRAVSSNYPGVSGKYINEFSVDTCPVTGDATKAKEYLAKALTELGYSSAADLPQMTYVTFERDDMKTLGEALVDSWKQNLGITSIQFVQYPIATAIQHFYKNDYDMFMISVGCTVTPLDTISSFTSNGSYSNFIVNWKSSLDESVNAAEALTFRSQEYYGAVAKAEQALLDEYSIDPLYNQSITYALADGVEGYVEPDTAFAYEFNHLTVKK